MTTGAVELQVALADSAPASDDLKYGLALNHMPSGKFGANAAWLASNVIAHNLARWVGRLAGPSYPH